METSIENLTTVGRSTSTSMQNAQKRGRPSPVATQLTTILHGPRTDLRNLIVIATGAMGLASFALLRADHYRHGLGWDQVAIQTIGGAGFIGVVFAVVHLALVVERAELSSEGIDLYGRMGRSVGHTIPWELLRPPKAPWLGFASLRWSSGGGVPAVCRVHVSRTILRAVLIDSRCPRWPLTPRVLRSLNLPEGWPLASPSVSEVPELAASDEDRLRMKIDLEILPSSRAALIMGVVWFVFSAVATWQAYYSGFVPEYSFAIAAAVFGVLAFIAGRGGFRAARTMTPPPNHCPSRPGTGRGDLRLARPSP